MKRNYGNLIHAMFVIVICACMVNCEDPNDPEIPVEANFSADDAGPNGITIQCGECVTFEDETTGDKGSLFWDFEGGDPASSEEFSSVRVCYQTPGKYDVSLSVNAGEDRITKEDFVCVLAKQPDPLDASFSANKTEIVQNQTVMFTDESTGAPDSWSWTIEGPGPIQTSEDQNPSFTLADPGLYTVKLTVFSGGIQDTEERVGYINVLTYQDFECLISSSEANNGFSTTFAYNDLDQLIKQDQFINGVSVGFNTYTWDDQGLLKLVENFDADEVIIGSEEYSYNEQSILNQQQFFDGSGNSLSNYIFTIDGGVITGGILEVPNGIGGIVSIGLEYIYDEDKVNVIQQRNFVPNSGQVTQTYNFEFDNQIRPFFDLKVEQFPERGFLNNPTHTTYSDGDGNIIFERTSEYQYNEYGRANFEERTSIGGVITQYTWEFECKKRE